MELSNKEQRFVLDRKVTLKTLCTMISTYEQHPETRAKVSIFYCVGPTRCFLI